MIKSSAGIHRSGYQEGSIYYRKKDHGAAAAVYARGGRAMRV